MNTTLMEESARKKIVDDLLVRKPKGDGSVKPTYNVVEYYCYDARKHKKRVECEHAGWGYTDETLWDLGFRCESDIRDYVFNTFYRNETQNHEYYLTSGQRAGVTRKTNRLESRVRGALRRVRSEGNLAGLYQVSIGYGNRFYFYGSSIEEVKSMSRTMLSAIYPDKEISVSFVDRSVPGDILDRNVSAFEKIERSVADLRKRAEKQIEEARRAEEQAEFVKTLITQNLDVALRAS